MIYEPSYRLPTVDEVLGGQTQGGIPRPKVSLDDIIAPSTAAEASKPARGRWKAMKAWLRATFGENRT